MFSMLSIKVTSIAPVTMWQTSTGHPNMDYSLPSIKMMSWYYSQSRIIYGWFLMKTWSLFPALIYSLWRWSFVWTGSDSRLERPLEKKQAFVKTVYASGSPRLFKNKTVEAGEKRPEMLLTVRLVDCWLAWQILGQILCWWEHLYTRISAKGQQKALELQIWILPPLKIISHRCSLS